MTKSEKYVATQFFIDGEDGRQYSPNDPVETSERRIRELMKHGFVKVEEENEPTTTTSEPDAGTD